MNLRRSHWGRWLGVLKIPKEKVYILWSKSTMLSQGVTASLVCIIMPDKWIVFIIQWECYRLKNWSSWWLHKSAETPTWLHCFNETKKVLLLSSDSTWSGPTPAKAGNELIEIGREYAGIIQISAELSCIYIKRPNKSTIFRSDEIHEVYREPVTFNRYVNPGSGVHFEEQCKAVHGIQNSDPCIVCTDKMELVWGDFCMWIKENTTVE